MEPNNTQRSRRSSNTNINQQLTQHRRHILHNSPSNKQRTISRLRLQNHRRPITRTNTTISNTNRRKLQQRNMEHRNTNIQQRNRRNRNTNTKSTIQRTRNKQRIQKRIKHLRLVVNQQRTNNIHLITK